MASASSTFCYQRQDFFTATAVPSTSSSTTAIFFVDHITVTVAMARNARSVSPPPSARLSTKRKRSDSAPPSLASRPAKSAKYENGDSSSSATNPDPDTNIDDNLPRDAGEEEDLFGDSMEYTSDAFNVEFGYPRSPLFFEPKDYERDDWQEEFRWGEEEEEDNIFNKRSYSRKARTPSPPPSPPPRPKSKSGKPKFDKEDFFSFNPLDESGSDSSDDERPRFGPPRSPTPPPPKKYTRPAPPKRTAPSLDEFTAWANACSAFFSSSGSKPFPKIEGKFCKKRKCTRGEKMGCCQHDVERVLIGEGNGKWDAKKLKKERLRWHTDKFCNGKWKKFEEEAKEMFQMVQALLDEAKKN